MRHPVTKLVNAHNRSVAEPSRALPHARMHDLRHLHATHQQCFGINARVLTGGRIGEGEALEIVSPSGL